jgi:hypothetical protein
LAVISVLIGSPAGPASAHVFGPHDNGTRYTDSMPVTFASDEDNTDHHLYWNHFVVWQQNIYDSNTDLRMQEQPRWYWDGLTDVVWFATPEVAPDLGDQSCRAISGDVCGRSRIRFRENLTRTIDQYVALHLVCHELAHAYGFGHLAGIPPEETSCLEPLFSLQPQYTANISGHMINHINARY